MTTMQAPRQVPSRPGTGRTPPAGRRGPAVPRRIAFWLVALVLAVTMLGTTLPTPLYVIYQGRWHFSAALVTVTLAGLGIFLAALALIVAALAESALPLFLAGTVAGGVATGAIFLGSLATANRLAPAGRRGQSLSAFFVACYAGLIIPVVGVGVLSGFTGTFPAVLTFSILLAALSLFSIYRFARVVTPVRGAR